MYSPWKILSEPRPNCEWSTGKKQLKKDISQEFSDRTRKTNWKMMKRQLTTAQNTPAVTALSIYQAFTQLSTT